MILKKRSGREGIEGQWTCGVLLQTPTKVVMVSEDLGKELIYKKIPGGRKRPVDKTPEDTAIREVFEETGVHITFEELNYVLGQDRRNHLYHLYTVQISDGRLEERYHIAKNGEEVHVVSINELVKMKAEILPHHFELLESDELNLSM